MQAVRKLGYLNFGWRPSALIVIAVILSGCAAGPQVVPEEKFRAAMTEAAILRAEDPAAAAAAYERMAMSARGEQHITALLAAASAWLEAGRPDEARRVIESLPEILEAHATSERELLFAEIELQEQQPRQALLRLAEPGDVPADLRDRAIRLRARALFQLGAIADATRLLDQHLQTLSNDTAREQNAELIWEGLSRSREPLTPEALPDDADARLRAWYALGRIGQQAWQEPYEFENRVRDWQQRNASHPAAQLLADNIIERHQLRFAYPRTIGLLLPLSGRFSVSADAVRDGFMAAYYQHAQYRHAPELLIRDTGETPETAVAAARSAVLDGAELLVGPLTKESLAAINAATDIEIPVLGLNYLDPENQANAREEIVQFGLLPEDEAIQVAERTIAEGLTRAVALVPDNDFGLRLLAAFRTRFEALGGEILNVQRYQTGQADYSTPIMRSLNLDESRLREQQLQAVLGRPLVFEPRRRQDVQFIFLAARFEEARLIKPQLEFHQALRLPVYATSSVYQPGVKADGDLDEIRFADMPWMLAPDETGASVRREIRQLWPRQFERNPRLYALGFDAFRLVPLIMQNDSALRRPLPAMSGLLSLDAQGRIRRDLYWAKIRNGQPRLLPALEKTSITRNVSDADSENGSR